MAPRSAWGGERVDGPDAWLAVWCGRMKSRTWSCMLPLFWISWMAACATRLSRRLLATSPSPTAAVASRRSTTSLMGEPSGQRACTVRSWVLSEAGSGRMMAWKRAEEEKGSLGSTLRETNRAGTWPVSAQSASPQPPGMEVTSWGPSQGGDRCLARV